MINHLKTGGIIIMQNAAMDDQINSNNHENQADDLLNIINNLPDWMLNSLSRRSMSDANTLFEQNESFSLEQIAYVIYRAYTLGVAVGVKHYDKLKEQ